MLSATLLGTGAACPTIERNVAALAVQREGETILFDCGEGTQRQMMRYGVSFAFREIFFTHYHADHVGGVAELLPLLQGPIYGPAHERMPVDVQRVAEGATFEVMGLRAEVLDVPWHTAGHIAYVAPLRTNGPMISGGDTLAALRIWKNPFR